MVTKKTSFKITKKPRRMALLVELTSFNIYSEGSTWKAEEDVVFTDSTVNVTIVFKGQKDQEYEMKMKINGIEKEIKGKLKKKGFSRVTRQYKISTFKIEL